jgi:hypothetical protein
MWLWSAIVGAANDAITNGGRKCDPAGSTEGYSGEQENTLPEVPLGLSYPARESRSTLQRHVVKTSHSPQRLPSARTPAERKGKPNHQTTA